MAYLGYFNRSVVAVDDNTIYASSGQKKVNNLKASESVVALQVSSEQLEVTSDTSKIVELEQQNKAQAEELTTLKNENLTLKSENKNTLGLVKTLKEKLQGMMKINTQLTKENEALKSELNDPLVIPSDFLTSEAKILN